MPLAEAVVFAMLASYVLSRTLVPTLAKYWLQKHDPHAAHQRAAAFCSALQQRFERGFERVRDGYRALLERALRGGAPLRAAVPGAMAVTALLAFPFGRYLPGLGQDFFPSVDAGQIKLHLRAPHRHAHRGDRGAVRSRSRPTIREVIPAHEIATIVDNIGVPYSGINLSYSTSAPVGPGRCRHLRRLERGPPARPRTTCASCARGSRRCIPSTSFAFLPADIVSQILNFGLPAPIDVQVSGFNVDANRAYANDLLRRMHTIPGAVDLRIQQAFDYPTLNVDGRPQQGGSCSGLTETGRGLERAGVAVGQLADRRRRSGSTPRAARQYNIVAQTPQYRLDSLTRSGHHAGHRRQQRQRRSCSPTWPAFRAASAPAVVSHYNATPVIDIYGAVAGHRPRLRRRADQQARGRDASTAAARLAGRRCAAR